MTLWLYFASLACMIGHNRPMLKYSLAIAIGGVPMVFQLLSKVSPLLLGKRSLDAIGKAFLSP